MGEFSYAASYVKCRKCGRIQFPRARCVECRSGEFEEVHPKWESGRLISFTLLYALPRRVKSGAPCALGIAEFGGVRSFGQLRVKNLNIGMKVKAVVDLVSEVGGKPVSGLVFTPEE